MSVTGVLKDPIPHGLKGYRKPFCCKCDVCRAAGSKYASDKRKEYRERDELSAKRSQRRRTESRNSVGDMEQAVIAECDVIPTVKATQVVAAKNLARLIDRLMKESAGAAVLNSATKQLMMLMSDIRGDVDKAKTTGKRKSGGRLATVGQLTKVRRVQ